MTNKKFKIAAMSLALTACVAASPIAANAETPENAPDAAQPSAVQHESEPDAAPAAEPAAEDKETPAQAPAALPAQTPETPAMVVELPAEVAPEEKPEEPAAAKAEEAEKTETPSPEQEPAGQPAEEPKAAESEDEQPAETEETPATIETPADDKAPAGEVSDTIETPSAAARSPEAAVEAPDDVEAAQPAIQPPVLPTADSPAAENPYGISTMLPGEGTQRAVSRGSAMIAGNENVIYGSIDDAVKNAESGFTIKVLEDSTCSGIDLDNKNLTIEGITNMVTEKDDKGNTIIKEVKPKLIFTKDGILLKNSNLLLKNLDVDMTGVVSVPEGDHPRWMGICLNQDSSLTLDSTDMVMDATGVETDGPTPPHGIYFAGNGDNVLNVRNGSNLTIIGYFNAITWDGTKMNPKSKYEINVTGKSSLTADRNGAGIVGMESLDVLVDDSTLTITNCTDRSGINGANVKIVNGSTANISNNHEGYGIHANDLLIEDSTVTANNNGYGGIRITGKGQFTGSRITVTGTENKGNASIEITSGKNEHGTEILNGSLDVRNSTLNVSDNNATGIACRSRTLTFNKNTPDEKTYHVSSHLTIDNASRVTIRNNHATPKNGFNAKGSIGGGLRIEEGASAVLGRRTILNNNHADRAGDDIFILPGGSLTFSRHNGTGNGDLLNDPGCGDKIDGWYTDAEGRRWDFHGDQNYVENILNGTLTLPEGVTLVRNGDGTYTLTVAADAAEGLALKAAHAELAPAPDPDDPTPGPVNPDPEPKPGPDTPVTPEEPELPPVQDAQPDAPDSPVLPSAPVLPAVQDAHALPQTGTSLFAALAMALSGFALMAAGAWASLTGRYARH